MVARTTVHLARNCPQRDPPAHCCSVRQTRASKCARGSTPPPPTFIELFAPFSSSSFLLFPLSTGPVPPSECPARVFSENYRTGLPPSIFESATQTTQSRAVELPSTFGLSFPALWQACKRSLPLSWLAGHSSPVPRLAPGRGLALQPQADLYFTALDTQWLMNYSCLPDPNLRWSSPARQHRAFF